VSDPRAQPQDLMLERRLEQSERSITPELIDRFAALM
jgi:hypothetical protein